MLSKDTWVKLAAQFDEIDKNGDGKISRAELEKAFEKAAPKSTQEQRDNTFMLLDTDGNGYFDWKEFCDEEARQVVKLAEAQEAKRKAVQEEQKNSEPEKKIV